VSQSYDRERERERERERSSAVQAHPSDCRELNPTEAESCVNNSFAVSSVVFAVKKSQQLPKELAKLTQPMEDDLALLSSMSSDCLNLSNRPH
jgi:hypothetical protein